MAGGSMSVAHTSIGGYALGVLLSAGALRELSNKLTKQWQHTSRSLTSALRTDHLIGTIATSLAAIAMLTIMALLESDTAAIVAGVLVAADWMRLNAMISCHQGLLDG
jgi:hypothetical protein